MQATWSPRYAFVEELLSPLASVFPPIHDSGRLFFAVPLRPVFQKVLDLVVVFQTPPPPQGLLSTGAFSTSHLPFWVYGTCKHRDSASALMSGCPYLSADASVVRVYFLHLHMQVNGWS